MTLLLGKVEARAGNLESAVQYFEEVLAQQPRSSAAREALEAANALLIGNPPR